MVGIIIVAHGNLSEELIATTSMIAGENIPFITSISITPTDSTQEVADKIRSAIRKVDDGDGVLIFTDMFGGTPSNISLSFLEEGRVEVISGVNLPMLLHATLHREGASLTELGRTLQATGRENISLASELLRKNGNGRVP
jgi:PTS system mannose-specific IIA component